MNNTQHVRPLSNDELVKIAPSIGTRQPHNKLSDKYSFVPTLTAVNLLRKDGWEPHWCDEVQAKHEGTQGYQRHVIRFSRKDLVLEQRRMELVMFNSHDGGSAFRLAAGLLEFVCANSMVCGAIETESFHRHVGFNSQKFLAAAAQMNGHLERTAEKSEAWGAIELSPDERGVYAMAAHTALYGKDKEGLDPRSLLQKRRYSQEPMNDLWTVFNNVQENVIKGGIMARDAGGRRVRTRPVKAIDADRKLNQALWLVTEHFAKYKMAA